VDLFFLLSGTVIEASYGAGLRAGMPLLQFLRIRIVRLYPLYILGTFVMVLAVALEPASGLIIDPPYRFFIPRDLHLLLAAIFCVPLLRSHAMYPLDPPAWSLFWEFGVNMVFWVLAPVMGRKLLAGIILVSGAVFLVLTLNGGIYHAASELGAADRAVFSFFLGVLLYREHARWRPAAWITPALPWLSAGIVCAVLASQHVTAALYLSSVFILFPASVWLALHAQPAAWQIPVWDALGDMSYPLYTLHVPLAALLAGLAGPIGGAPWSGLAGFASLAGIALLLDRYYDRPVRRWLRPRR